uniref:Uncharacterized protein n=1 Tax=Vitis vinifera TaxID=29760 RepID=A5BFL7_VITVI|nr:hypothetical protein VITISV_023980 [Vitis vinifera]
MPKCPKARFNFKEWRVSLCISLENQRGKLSGAGNPDYEVKVVRMSYVCKCRLNFLEAVRIRKARHVYPDEGDPDDNACHVSP